MTAMSFEAILSLANFWLMALMLMHIVQLRDKVLVNNATAKDVYCKTYKAVEQAYHASNVRKKVKQSVAFALVMYQVLR